MKQVIKAAVISFFHLGCFWSVNCFLQTKLNKMMQGDFYVLIILFLNVVAPVLIFYLSNLFLFKVNNNYSKKTSTICLSNGLLFCFGVVHVLFFKDSNFLGVGLWIYLFWVFIVSVVFIAYCLTRRDKK